MSKTPSPVKRTVTFHAVGFSYRENPITPEQLMDQSITFDITPTKGYPDAVKIMIDDTRHVAYVAELNTITGEADAMKIKWLVENDEISFIEIKVTKAFKSSCDILLTFEGTKQAMLEFDKLSK